jgi:hypothetical protein
VEAAPPFYLKTVSMNTKTLYVLIAAAALMVGIAIAVQVVHQHGRETVTQAGPLLPTLRGHLNDVSEIKLTGSGSQVIATLKRTNEGWVEKAGYPANFTKIRELLLKLDQSTLIEPKTSNPKLYAQIGVDDVKDAAANGVQVDLNGLAQPTTIIVGVDNADAGAGTFVRRDNEAQSWLASGDLAVAKSAAEWEKRDLADIAPSRIRAVTLTAPDGKVVRIFKDRAGDADFKLADAPKGREANPVLLDSLGSTLANLTVDDVFPASERVPPERAYRANYFSFDGLTVNAVTWQADGKSYVQFSATLDPARASEYVLSAQAKAKADYETAALAAKKSPPAENKGGATPEVAPETKPPVAKPLAVSDPEKDRQDRLNALTTEASALNKSFSGWTFVLPEHKFTYLTKTANDMLKPLPPKNPSTKGAPKPGSGSAAEPSKK